MHVPQAAFPTRHPVAWPPGNPESLCRKSEPEKELGLTERLVWANLSCRFHRVHNHTLYCIRQPHTVLLDMCYSTVHVAFEVSPSLLFSSSGLSHTACSGFRKMSDFFIYFGLLATTSVFTVGLCLTVIFKCLENPASGIQYVVSSTRREFLPTKFSNRELLQQEPDLIKSHSRIVSRDVKCRVRTLHSWSETCMSDPTSQSVSALRSSWLGCSQKV
jgi:hypothetical protein